MPLLEEHAGLWPPLHVIGGQRGGTGRTEQRQRESQLVGQHLQRASRPHLAIDRQAPEGRRPTSTASAPSASATAMSVSAPDAAVDQHRDPSRNGLDDLGQGIDRAGAVSS